MTTLASTPATSHRPLRAAITTDRVAVTVVTVAALVVSIVLWRRYLPHWELLWTDLIHDRSAHLDFGVQPASDLLHLRPVDLLRDLNAFRTWPPVHDGVLVGATMLVTGLDVRYAVLPSLVAFAVTAVLALLCTRRILPRYGNLGGSVAAVLVLASPAMRAFATDVMIESTGACLTLLVLYAALRVRQQPTIGAWRFFAIATTALFFTKYNYWLVAVASTLPCRWPVLRSLRGRALPSPARWFVWCALGVLLTVGAGAGFLDTTALRATTLAGALALIASLWWGFTAGAALLHDEVPARMLYRWTVVPILVWCCLPGKLGSFLWFAWPFTNEGGSPARNPLGGVSFYADAFAHEYHSGVVIACVVALFVLVAVVAYFRGRLEPGAAVAMLLLGLALLVTVPHPNRHERFLHPMMPVVWVVAGAGVGVVIEAVARRRTVVAVVAAGLLIAWQAPALADDAHAVEGGVQHGRPSALAITDSCLPLLESATAPAIVSNIPLRFLARWTYQERYGRDVRPVTELPGFDVATAGPANRAAVETWLRSGAVDAVLVVDVGRSSPWYVEAPGADGLAALPSLMRHQGTFVRSETCEVGHDTRVELWVPPSK